MEISRVAIVGMGTMGQGICQLLASSNCSVSVVDVSDVVVEKGINEVSRSLEKAVERGKITGNERERVLSNISNKRIEELRNEDLIIECVTENPAIKRKILKNLDSLAGPRTLFASNTSSLTISEISEGLSESRIVVGMHFFNPVWALPLVELIMPSDIPEDLKEAIRVFLVRNGRQVVEVKDSPGFVVNRLLFGMIAESLILLDGGIANRDAVDTAMKAGAKFPMGPFELIDLIGLDVTAEILDRLADRLGSDVFQRASHYLTPMIERGLLGRKVGRGFYEYER